jgi:predicted HAD superfamily Cof-like phosphohydrolase
MTTPALQAREFTLAAGNVSPDKPTAMTRDDVVFLSRMVIDELMELGATVMQPHEVTFELHSAIRTSKTLPQITYGPAEQVKQVADQADALVDAWYYMADAAAKKGINVGPIYDLVHAANMKKCDPATGKFIRRADGKIIKPPGWEAADVEAEIGRQMENGAWT